MAKYRAKANYATVYASDKQGYNLGLDGSIYLKREVTARSFNAPAIGTQGVSTSDATPSVDISGSSNRNGRINVDGTGVTAFGLSSVTGLDTGLEIAAALETAINTALAAAGLDARVWADYSSSVYHVYSQSTGTSSSVVITDGASLDLMTELKLGTGNSGTEAAGTNDADFLLYTTGGINFSQPVESNQHRSGRFHSGIIRQKKVCEFDFDTYINMAGSAGESIDTAVSLLMEAVTGKKTTTASTYIDFEQGLPTVYMSIVRVSTIFGEYYTGGYVKQMNLTFPGDGPATVKYQGKASDASIAGIAQLNGAVSASTDVILNSGESKRYTAGARVMAVSTDGRTITNGADGSLYIASVDDTTHKLVLSTAVSLSDDTYIVPWDPGAVGQTAKDAIFTDLLGTFKLDSADSAVDVTNIELTLNNDHVDLDNRFGSDANKGYVAGNRLSAELSVTFDLSNETLAKVVRTREFAGYAPEIVLGSVSSGRYLKITAPKWIPAVPAIEVPENGTTPVTLTGMLFQTSAGANNPFRLRFG